MIVPDRVDNENPYLHWKYIECSNEIVADLGCGRWESVEYRDLSWPTTPEYLLSLGASKVYAFDVDKNEIQWYKNNISTKSPQIEAITLSIDSLDKIRHIYSIYKPTVIKCDIEFNEHLILGLTDIEFCSIKFYAIETHSNDLYDSFLNRFKEFNYEITGLIDLVHAPPMKVIFAKKNKVKTNDH